MKITHLVLFTTDLEAQKRFYHDLLGFYLADSTSNSFTISIGKDLLTFRRSKKQVHYHFAFNIPCDAIELAHLWLAERTDLIKDGENEIINYSHWDDAKAIFFKDAGGNLTEFIARKSVKEKQDEEFNSDMVLSISEIGIPVDDISTVFNSINKQVELSIYDGGMERFCALGDEEGLFICINKQAKTWFPSNEVGISSPFRAEVNIKGADYTLRFERGIVELAKL